MIFITGGTGYLGSYVIAELFLAHREPPRLALLTRARDRADFVEKLWRERMMKPVKPLRDPKTQLQEWAQGRGLPTPVYREVERTGPHHNPVFRVAVDIPQKDPAEGVGRSKRAAEQAAAAAMLTRDGVAMDVANG